MLIIVSKIIIIISSNLYYTEIADALLSLKLAAVTYIYYNLSFKIINYFTTSKRAPVNQNWLHNRSFVLQNFKRTAKNRNKMKT